MFFKLKSKGNENEQVSFPLNSTPLLSPGLLSPQEAGNLNARQHGCIAGDPTDSQVKRQMVKSENLKPRGSYRRPEIPSRMEELAGVGVGEAVCLRERFPAVGEEKGLFSTAIHTSCCEAVKGSSAVFWPLIAEPAPAADGPAAGLRGTAADPATGWGPQQLTRIPTSLPRFMKQEAASQKS